MDREITQEVRTRKVVRRVVTFIAILAVAGGALAAAVEWLRPSLKRREIQTARVVRGTVEETLQAAGTVVPLVEQVVSSPVEARVVGIGRRAGDRVTVGDALVTLDTAATQLDFARLAERMQQKESESTQLRLRLDESIATLQAQIEQKQLDVEIFRYTAEQKEKLRSEGLTAQQEALASAAQAKKADIELRQLKEALARTLRSRDAQLAASQVDLSIARREREESKRQLEMAMMRAPSAGVLTWVVTEQGATVRRGDILARIADLSSFRLSATISDIHAARLSAGQRTRVKLDEATTIPGTIESIDPRIENGVVRFFVMLDQPAHPRLRNNLRADVAVVTSQRDRVLSARRGRLGENSERYAFVVREDELVRVPVRFGIAGDEAIEIVSGLREGDEVVISDMSDSMRVERLRLK
ncbi:MAG TPA: HlyD family efflux transporter periplasmic adaptor subunit [Thermoanaerobaculia bacterium]|jgi:HlyD family secretion protein